jgi:MarR family
MSAAPTDEVDRIVEAWQRERPDLDVAPLTILSRVLRLARHLDLARGQAFAEHDLEGWGFDVLSALRREGAPYELSPGQLVAQTLVTSGTMTNRVDRLAARGLVSRGPDPSGRPHRRRCRHGRPARPRTHPAQPAATVGAGSSRRAPAPAPVAVRALRPIRPAGQPMTSATESHSSSRVSRSSTMARSALFSVSTAAWSAALAAISA